MLIDLEKLANEASSIKIMIAKSQKEVIMLREDLLDDILLPEDKHEIIEEIRQNEKEIFSLAKREELIKNEIFLRLNGG